MLACPGGIEISVVAGERSRSSGMIPAIQRQNTRLPAMTPLMVQCLQEINLSVSIFKVSGC